MIRIVWIGVPLTFLLAVTSPAGERRLTLLEAEHLAAAALNSPTNSPPRFSLLPPPLPPKNGATFEVVWLPQAAHTAPRSTVVVDIDTAEVWDPTPCAPLSTPALQLAQRHSRSELKITDAEVNNARIRARNNGCSNLLDERPDKTKFVPHCHVGFSANEDKTLYRYVISVSDVVNTGVSAVPLKIRDGGEVNCLNTRTSLYVIDDDGLIQELFDESRFVLAVKR